MAQEGWDLTSGTPFFSTHFTSVTVFHSLLKELDSTEEHVQVAARRVLFLLDYINNLQRRE